MQNTFIQKDARKILMKLTPGRHDLVISLKDKIK